MHFLGGGLTQATYGHCEVGTEQVKISIGVVKITLIDDNTVGKYFCCKIYKTYVFLLCYFESRILYTKGLRQFFLMR